MLLSKQIRKSKWTQKYTFFSGTTCVSFDHVNVPSQNTNAKLLEFMSKMMWLWYH